MINVNKPFFPPRDVVKQYVDQIWENGWLTNDGPLVKELELKLKEYLGVDHFLFMSNGTISLQIAMRALGLKGEILTTPFSFVATTSSIVWEYCKPVFVDIDKDSFNMDPALIEEKITRKTTAILATHVFGNPCDTDAIDNIAKRYNLKVIYDAAHCFGVYYKGKSLYHFGDISSASFHATKVFHTVEGGGVFTRDYDLLKRMTYMRNFGHDGPEKFNGVGINAKNSEMHAAIGLANLPFMGSIIKERQRLSALYRERLGPHVEFQLISAETEGNFAYMPVLFESESQLLNVIKYLNAASIFPRRYFYPSLSKLNYVTGGHTPVADNISSRILCLPMYAGLAPGDVDIVCNHVNNSLVC